MAGTLAEVFATALIRGGLSAADLATAPPFFDFVGDGHGTGKPNTCIMTILGKESDGCEINVDCNGVTTSHANIGCETGSSFTVSDAMIGDYTFTIGDDPTNEAPFAGTPGLFLQTLQDDDPDTVNGASFEIGQCNGGKGSQEGMFTGTACDSDDEIDLKLCFSEQMDNFSTYMYWIAVPTVGTSYACNTSK